MAEEQIKLANSYIKLDEVTELIGDLLCIPDFESRNITEGDVRKVYDKILDLDRKVDSDNNEDLTEWEYDEINCLHICKKCGMSELWQAKFCPNCGRKAIIVVNEDEE